MEYNLKKQYQTNYTFFPPFEAFVFNFMLLNLAISIYDQTGKRAMIQTIITQWATITTHFVHCP